MNDIVSVRDKFDTCVRESGIKLYKTGEPTVNRCTECGKNVTDAYESDILTVNLIDRNTRNISGCFCNSCGAIIISNDRIKSLEKYCNADFIKSVTTKSRSVISDETVRMAQKRFNPKTTTLYVHQGRVKCLTNNHNVISVALRIPSTGKSSSVIINANYCSDCDRFFLSSDEYEHYRSIYPIMLLRFEYVTEDGSSIGNKLADKSPLMLAGYTVRANSNYSEEQRHNILRKIIELGILKKHEVINYLNYFISMNGKARGMETAVTKWEKDLEYVRSHNFELQNKAVAKEIKKWR